MQGNKGAIKQQQHLNAAGSGGMKAPPVPTLVRGCGSSLVGKKAIHMSEDTVRVGASNYTYCNQFNRVKVLFNCIRSA